MFRVLGVYNFAYCEKKSSSDHEKLLKFVAEGQEFAKMIDYLQILKINKHPKKTFYDLIDLIRSKQDIDV